MTIEMTGLTPWRNMKKWLLSLTRMRVRGNDQWFSHILVIIKDTHFYLILQSFFNVKLRNLATSILLVPFCRYKKESKKTDGVNALLLVPRLRLNGTPPNKEFSV